MADDSRQSDWKELNDGNRRIWDAIAEWWDDRIGDGNEFQDELIEPATERLIEVVPGTAVLDIGCGAGRFARRMADLGANVVAFDFSERFIERARSRTAADVQNIEYHVIDATKKEELLSLGAGRFDGAVATMCLMDMAAIEPLMGALPVLLKPEGRFVFSVMHPCFQPFGFRKFVESYEEDGEIIVRSGIKVTEYLTPRAWKGIGIVGQPETQYYFHRPLSVIFGTAFRNGFVIDGFEEPVLREAPDDKQYLRWRHMRDIPPILVVRMRLLKK